MNSGRMFTAKVEEVHSGDDFVLLVDLGISGLHKRTRARLHGVDAPNAYKAGGDTEAGKVRDEIRALLLASKCQVELVSEGKGGWIVRLIAVDQHSNTPVCVNTLLQNRGYTYNQHPA